MNQQQHDEIHRLYREDYLAVKECREAIAVFGPLATRHTPESMPKIRVLMDERDGRQKEAKDKLLSLIVNCDHRTPDGKWNFHWSPCDTARCSYCGVAEEDVDPKMFFEATDVDVGRDLPEARQDGPGRPEEEGVGSDRGG